MFSKSRKILAVGLALLLGATQATAGLLFRSTEGLVMTGADGIRYEGPTGLVMTGADAILGLDVNGISWSPADGLVMTGADGSPLAQADGVSWRAERADGVNVNHANGLVMTGADGLVMTGADGTTYQAAAVSIRQADGLVMTGADGLVMTGADGLRHTENNGLVMTGADGLVMTGADYVRTTRAAEVTATAPDGRVFRVSGDGLVMTGADGLVMTGADGLTMTNVQGLVMTGADGLVMTGADGLVMTGADATDDYGIGIRSIDPLLLKHLEAATDDSNINAAIVFHGNRVTEDDIAELRRIGITGGTRFRSVPAVIISAMPHQMEAISHLPRVRSMYTNRTLQWSADKSRETTGLARARSDADLTRRFGNTPVSGAGVGVAVIDTGLDASHPDFAGRVSRNVKLADVQGIPTHDFVYPVNIEGLQNTDLVSGHGTLVSSIIAGTGARSAGRYRGYAPGARLVGLSAGDVSLFHVVAAFDFILQNREIHNIKVVNCSFSSNGHFDLDDPVNVATKMLADAGVNVVFSAGNTGPGLNTLNPYARVPWVVSVGATDERGRPAKFSARGDYGSGVFRPTLVAPGTSVVGARAAGVSVTGLNGLLNGDTAGLSLLELPHYTTASGTSFSAPQVAGTIALMLQANPQLTPEQVRGILRRTATPLAPYLAHEVGAGMLNTHAAVLEAAFPERHLSEFRSTVERGQVSFVKDGPQEFKATAVPGHPTDMGVQIPDGALLASVEIAWGPFTTLNDLGLFLHDPSNVRRAESNYVNLPGLTGRRERTVVPNPQPGLWQARVQHSIGLTGTTQSFTGTVEIGRVEYTPLADTSSYAGTPAAEDIRYALRNYVMLPDGNYFRPDAVATRAELAAALLLGGRTPLYVAAQPRFTDVTDPWARSYVESAQARPGGALFYDAQPGGAFNPAAPLTRLAAAIALVRAAGLEAEAQAAMTDFYTFTDAPWQWRGYVVVASRRGLLPPAVNPDPNADGHFFMPQQTVTRAQLAGSMRALGALVGE